MSDSPPGIEFEKIVAEIQAQIDPASKVTHDEILLNRLGHARQFDVVVRGTFAGQPMLGIIECKDLKRKVGTPEVDGFVTKAQDINANFKVLMSRNGFTKPALAQCAHNGIQALSLLNDDPANKHFFVGTRWKADVTRWNQISVTLHFEKDPGVPVHFSADELRIEGKKVLDWFTNHLLDQQNEITELGWVVDFAVVFDEVQSVEISAGVEYLCKAISFKAERVCDELERLVGVSGTGFFNWNASQATFPPATTIRTEAVPIDFSQWLPRSGSAKPPSGFVEMHLFAHQSQFERVQDAIELDKL